MKMSGYKELLIGNENSLDDFGLNGRLNFKYSCSVMGPCSINNGKKGRFAFYKGSEVNNVLFCDADLIFCNELYYHQFNKLNKNIFFSNEPKLNFVRLLNLFDPRKVSITVGKNFKKGSNCSIGNDGFGFVKEPDGRWVRFPHFGNVVIGDNVEIGDGCCIDRGTLDDTVIGDGTKMDNHVHIGHNCVVGKNVILTAKVMLAGGVTIGDDCYFHPGVLVGRKVHIIDGCEIGMGSVVTKSLMEPGLYYGSPAKLTRRY